MIKRRAESDYTPIRAHWCATHNAIGGAYSKGQCQWANAAHAAPCDIRTLFYGPSAPRANGAQSASDDPTRRQVNAGEQ